MKIGLGVIWSIIAIIDLYLAATQASWIWGLASGLAIACAILNFLSAAQGR